MEISNRQALLKQRKIVEKAVGDYARKVNRDQVRKSCFPTEVFYFCFVIRIIVFSCFYYISLYQAYII